jgi:hypothetical protein
MAKDKLTDYDSTASGNLDVGGISVAEGMLPSGVNNAIRELMSHQADAFGAGTPLYVDQTNNRLGVGNAAPTTALTVDADGATVATFDRATSDGTIIDVQKDGTTVGSIGASVGDLYIGTGVHGLKFVDASTDIRPFNTSTGASSDATTDLGNSTSRFKDLFLSGGVYLGGTGSANHLDDYEEGTWTPTIKEASRATSVTYEAWSSAAYTKVGNTVFAIIELGISSHDGTTSAAAWTFGGFPISVSSARGGYSIYNNNSGSIIGGGRFDSGSYNGYFYGSVPTSCTLYVSFVYQTNA